MFLALLATFAGATLVDRAARQGVVIDEADSYILFAAPEGLASALYPSSGNHLLNTYLARASTRAFGLSELTLRLPAVAGGFLYIGSALSLVLLLEAGWLVSVPLFICLAYNPLILDYLIAARGYSLALGFFMAALALFARDRHPALVSMCIGLSISANFSFAVVDVLLLLLTCRRKRLIETFAPAAAVVSLLCGWTLLHWPAGQFYWGALSLSEMWTGIFAASFADPLPFLARLFPKSGEARTRMIVSIVDAVAAVPLIVVALRAKRSLGLASLKLLSALLALTFLVHWCAFLLGYIRLPLTRTGLFFLPLCTLIVGFSLAACPPRMRQVGSVVLLLNALWFAACFRTGYFLEYALQFRRQDRLQYPAPQEEPLRTE